MMIASDEVAYKLIPETRDTETSSDPIVPEVAPSSPGSPQLLPRPASLHPPSPPPPSHPKAGPNREATWRNVDLSSWDFPDNPFRRVQEGLEELQH
jgi:hypothetical protein